MARPKGNKIRLTIEISTLENLNQAKINLVAKVQEMFESLISLRADVSEVVVEPEPKNE